MAIGTSSSIVSSATSLPGQHDLTHQLLSVFFAGYGPFSADSATTYSNTIGNIMFITLTVLAAIITSRLAWHAIKLIVHTGQEGKLLGQKFGAWSPVRVALAFGLVTPVSGGFCMASFLVMSIALMGASWGNLGEKAITKLSNDTIVMPRGTPSGRIIADMTAAEACYVAGLIPSDTSNLTDASSFVNPYITYPTSSETGLVKSALLMPGNAWNLATAAIAGTNYNANNDVFRVSKEWNYGACGTISGMFANGSGAVGSYGQKKLADIEKARASIHNAMLKAYSAVIYMDGREEEETYAVDFAKAIAEAKNQLDKDLISDATSLISTMNSNNGTSQDNVDSVVNTYGYMTTVPLFNSIMSSQTLTTDLASELPSLKMNTDTSAEADYMNKTAKAWGIKADTHKFVEQLNVQLGKLEKTWADESMSNVKTQADITNVVIANQNTDTRNNSLAGIYDNVAGYIGNTMRSRFLEIDPVLGHEMQQVVDFGADLENVGDVLFGGGVATDVAGMTGAGKAVSAAIKSAGGDKMLYKSGIALIVMGLFLKIILPLTIIIYFGKLIAQYLVFVVCVVLEIPFAMLTLSSMEGTELFEREQGIVFGHLMHIATFPIVFVLGVMLFPGALHIELLLQRFLIYPVIESTQTGMAGQLILCGLVCVMVASALVAAYKLTEKLISVQGKFIGFDACAGDQGEAHRLGVQLLGYAQNVKFGGAGGKPADDKGGNGVTGGDDDGPGPGGPGGGIPAPAGAAGVTRAVRTAAHGVTPAPQGTRNQRQGVSSAPAPASAQTAQALSMGDVWNKNVANKISQDSGISLSGQEVGNVIKTAHFAMSENPGTSLRNAVENGIKGVGKVATPELVDGLTNAIKGE